MQPSQRLTHDPTTAAPLTTAQPAPRSPAVARELRIGGLDVLRSLAVLSVVAYHLPRSPTNFVARALTHFGWSGVDLFFVLSGYLIANQYFVRPAAGQPPATWRFYARRFIRTLPNYYVVLALYLLLPDAPAVSVWRYLTFTQNFASIQMFTISWSLCVEEQFYLVFPVVALALLHTRSRRAVLAAVTTVVLGGIALRAGLWQHFRPDLALARSAVEGWDNYLVHFYNPTHTRLDGLTAGVALACVRRFEPDRWKRWLARGNQFLAAGLGVLALGYALLVRQFSFLGCVLGFPCLALGFALLVVAALSPTSWLQRIATPVTGQIALMSYAVYLTHARALSLAATLVARYGFESYSLPGLLVGFVLIAALGAALYYLVERPMLRARDRLLGTTL